MSVGASVCCRREKGSAGVPHVRLCWGCARVECMGKQAGTYLGGAGWPLPLHPGLLC